MFRAKGVSDVRVSDYAFISDCQSAGLVSRDGSVDWLCMPRFDSPSVFCALLDEDRGGAWAIRPAEPHTVSRRYEPDTLVLITRFETDSGVLELRDALAFPTGARGHDIGLSSPHRLVREVRGVSGNVHVISEANPRPEYGLSSPVFNLVDGCCVKAVAGAVTLWFDATVALSLTDGPDRVTSTFDCAEGDSVVFSMTYEPTFRSDQAAEARSAKSSERPPLDGAIDDTAEAWRSWSADHWGEGFGYEGPARDAVRFSALVLQGLTYQPSGAVIAACTTSLPERPGEDWNWDYRYGWLRDAAFVMRALWVAACPSEPEAFFRWLAVAAGKADASAVQIVYGVEGERDLSERELPHLSGFANSRPVRVGNDAWRQSQLDVVGEVLDAAYQLDEKVGTWSASVSELLRGFADFAAARWRDPDAGMWEARTRLRQYTSSRVLCWVALDRALRLGERIGATPEQVASWTQERDLIHSTVLQEAWSEEKQSFTGAFDSASLDVSVLLMPLVGFIEANDPRMLKTLDAIERELVVGPLLRRWPSEPHGFVLASYWMVGCLAMSGQLDRARERFDQITALANDVGLLAEEADAEGESLGNFPQGFSHVGLINAAWELSLAEQAHAE